MLSEQRNVFCRNKPALRNVGLIAFVIAILVISIIAYIESSTEPVVNAFVDTTPKFYKPIPIVCYPFIKTDISLIPVTNAPETNDLPSTTTTNQQMSVPINFNDAQIIENVDIWTGKDNVILYSKCVNIKKGK
jgi:hypothetical protein